MIQYTIVMKPVTKEILKLSADRIMLELDDSEYDSLIEELNEISLSLEEISKIPGIDEISPMTFPFDVTSTHLREDEAGKPLDKEDALKNSSDVVDGQIRLPKVVG